MVAVRSDLVNDVIIPNFLSDSLNCVASLMFVTIRHILRDMIFDKLAYTVLF